MRINRLEDLIVWQEARILMKLVYKTTEKFPTEEKYNLVRHMRECARNIPANIAEGFGRYHYQESMQFYRIARGSLFELRSDVYSSFDTNYINKLELDTLINQIDKVGSLLNGFINHSVQAKAKNSKSANSTNNE